MRLSVLPWLCVLLMSMSGARAQDLWTDRTAEAGIGGILNGVAFGNGLFVAVGTNSVFGLIHSSPDGETWTDHTQTANIGGILNGVAFGDGRFVAVGTNTAFGLIASSTNGTAWTDHTAAANVGGILRDVAFGAGVWVAVGDIGGLGVIATSTNGVTWTNRTSTANVAGILHGVTFADGQFVVVGTNGALVVFAVSTNGQDWNVHTTTNAIGGVAYDVVHDGDQFIATGDGTPSGGSTTAHVLTSANGISWMSRTIGVGLGGIGFGLGSGGGTAVLVGRTGAPGLIATSQNGVDWSNLTVASQAPGDLHGVVRGPQRWVAVGTNQVNGVVMTSDTESGGDDPPMFFDDVIEVGSHGGNFQASILAGAGVEWTVTKDAEWIFLSGASGTGNGQATVSLQFNNSAQPRSATLTVGTDVLIVNQAGTPLNAPVLNGSYLTESDEVGLFWNQVFAAGGYRIERRVGAEGEFTVIAEPAGSAVTSASDATVSGGVTYDYRIRAFSGQLNSDWSNIVTVGAPPDIPDDLVATARNASQIELTWTDVSGEAGYLIFRAANDEGFLQQVARIPADETRYIDSGLEAASFYRYEIEAESMIFGRRSPEASAETGEIGAVVWGEAESGASGGYFGVAMGNGVAVVVGADGRVTTSPDLGVWADETPPTGETLRAIAFAQNQFVAVGDSGVILGSADGAAWTPAASPADEDLVSIAFSQGLWAAVGEEGALLTSPDGITWTNQPSPAEHGFVNVFAGGNKFVAIEDTGRFLTSDDGMTWRETRAGEPDDETEPFFWTRTAGAFGGNAYSVVGPNSRHSFGMDAESWSEENDNSFNYFEAVAYGAGQFAAVGLNGRTGYSATGQGYFGGGSQETSLYCVAHGPGGFVAAGDRGLIVTSANGITWTTVQEPGGTAAHLATIVAGDGQLVVFGQTDFDSVTIRNDFDGMGWIEQPFSVGGIEFSPVIYDALYAAGQYVAVGSEGVVATSPDGQTWTTRRTREPGPFNDELRGIAAGPNQLIAAGGNDPLLSSGDGGVTWDAIAGLPNQFNAWNVSYGPRWVSHFGGSGTLRLHYSDDATEWMPGFVVGNGRNVSKLTLGHLDGEPLYAGVGAQFGGGSPQAMASWDGRNWNVSEAGGIDAAITAMAHGSGVFVAAGSGGALVWASLDGVHWEPAPAGFLPEEVALNGGIRDLAYFQGQFYGVGLSGLIVRMEIGSSAIPPGPMLQPALVEIARDGPNFLLSWPSQAGLTYQVLRRSDLGADDWIPAGPVRQGNGEIMTFEAEAAAGAHEEFWVIVTSLDDDGANP